MPVTPRRTAHLTAPRVNCCTSLRQVRHPVWPSGWLVLASLASQSGLRHPDFLLVDKMSGKVQEDKYWQTYFPSNTQGCRQKCAKCTCQCSLLEGFNSEGLSHPWNTEKVQKLVLSDMFSVRICLSCPNNRKGIKHKRLWTKWQQYLSQAALRDREFLLVLTALTAT